MTNPYSDHTLIDDAFNNQTTVLNATQAALTTEQLPASATVPEQVCVVLASVALVAGRYRR